MNVICVDDEKLLVELTVSLCRELPNVDNVTGFSFPNEALEYVKSNRVDIALLDIDMPEMTGLELASKVKTVSPDTAIIFLTGYSQYALEALRLHASGYLLKPIDKESLAAEVAFAAGNIQKQSDNRICIKTFGDFRVLVDEKAVIFRRSKSKELLAYLVDRQGAPVSRADIFSVLWEEGMYDRAKQKELDVIVRSLKHTLEENGISDIIEIKSGNIRVCPEKFQCDLYDFLKGDVSAVNSYRGEYMNSYSWAMPMEAYIDRRIDKDN